MGDAIEVFHDSLTRCLGDPAFMDRFYDTFLASSDDVRSRFRGTDFARQKRMLKTSLFLIMLANDGQPEGVQHLERIAERHSARGLDIPPRLYVLWLDALLDTVRATDPRCDPSVLAAWDAMMAPGIAAMVARHSVSRG